MNREKDFYRSVNVLQKAFFNGTLKHGDPCGCAVGNLITDRGFIRPEAWYDLKDCEESFCKKAEMSHLELKTLPYSYVEIWKIEKSFESTESYSPRFKTDKDDSDGYLGLCAVLDTLMEIHEFDKAIPSKEKIFSKQSLELLTA